MLLRPFSERSVYSCDKRFVLPDPSDPPSAPGAEPGRGEESALVHSFLGYGDIYVVADPDTTAEEWAQQTFGIAVQNQSIRLFLDRADADSYAMSIRAQQKDGTLMVMKPLRRW